MFFLLFQGTDRLGIVENLDEDVQQRTETSMSANLFLVNIEQLLMRIFSEVNEKIGIFALGSFIQTLLILEQIRLILSNDLSDLLFETSEFSQGSENTFIRGGQMTGRGIQFVFQTQFVVVGLVQI